MLCSSIVLDGRVLGVGFCVMLMVCVSGVVGFFFILEKNFVYSLVMCDGVCLSFG